MPERSASTCSSPTALPNPCDATLSSHSRALTLAVAVAALRADFEPQALPYTKLRHYPKAARLDIGLQFKNNGALWRNPR